MHFAGYPGPSSLVDVNALGKTRWSHPVRLLCLTVGCTQLKSIARAQIQIPLQTVAPAAESRRLSATPPASGANAPTFPLADVHRGLRGVAYTVFEGVNPEPMDVEILGVLKNAIGPGQDMILARLHGQKPEYTGVVAGMSGSPVYIDGKLLGALSYRIGQFSKEPIAGITPIAQMFEVRDGSAKPVATKTRTPEGQLTVQPMETPLSFGGFSQEAIDRFGDRFRVLGLVPVSGLGGRDATVRQPEPLIPGSAVSAVLVQGDLSITGTCTVTYVDPSRLLACGHPITQFGSVDMPMTKADVVATLPSPLNAFKIVNATETVGAFTEDRASAIMGRFGTSARMIPVEVTVHPTAPATASPAPDPSKNFHFEVLDNRQLTPSAMLVSVYQTLSATNTASAEMSLRLTGELSLSHRPGVAGPSIDPVHLSGLITQSDFNPAAINAALYINDRVGRLYGNPSEQPVITGLKISVDAIPDRLSATLDSAHLLATEARPGDTIEVEAILHPFHASPKLLRTEVHLPPNLSPGQLRILVSDGATLDRIQLPRNPGPATPPRGIADTVTELNRLHPNDAIYVTLLDHAAQAVLESSALTEVPLSMANVLDPMKDAQKVQLNGESALELGAIPTGYSVIGSQVLNLVIR